MTPGDPGSEELRQAFYSLSERAAPSLDCPDAGRLWDALDGSATFQEVRLLLDHTLVCPACAESWRLALRLRADAGLDADTAVGLPRPRPWWHWTLAAAAAAASVVLLVSLGALRFGSTPAPASAYRQASAATIHSLVPEAVALPRNHCVLRWACDAADARYELRVATMDLTVLETVHGLAASEVQVAETALAGLPDGSKLVWQVDAILPDGSRISSPTFICTLK